MKLWHILCTVEGVQFYLFIEELAVLKYKYIHKRKYSVVQNKQKRKKNNRLQLRH